MHHKQAAARLIGRLTLGEGLRHEAEQFARVKRSLSGSRLIGGMRMTPKYAVAVLSLIAILATAADRLFAQGPAAQPQQSDEDRGKSERAKAAREREKQREERARTEQSQRDRARAEQEKQRQERDRKSVVEGK